MQNKLEMVERSSGYWIVDKDGVIDGPFELIEEAQTSFAHHLVFHQVTKKPKGEEEIKNNE